MFRHAKYLVRLDKIVSSSIQTVSKFVRICFSKSRTLGHNMEKKKIIPHFWTNSNIQFKNRRNKGKLDTPAHIYMTTPLLVAWYRHFNKKWQG